MQKQMKSLFTTMLAIGLFCQSQAADLFTPVQKTELRAPFCATDYFRSIPFHLVTLRQTE